MLKEPSIRRYGHFYEITEIWCHSNSLILRGYLDELVGRSAQNRDDSEATTIKNI